MDVHLLVSTIHQQQQINAGINETERSKMNNLNITIGNINVIHLSKCY